MLDYVMKNIDNPMYETCCEVCNDKPLYEYVIQAISELEIINMLSLHRIKDDDSIAPFLYVGNWNWNPHPPNEEIQYRRRETGTKVLTKTIGDTRLGFLDFDIYVGGRDKNNKRQCEMIHNRIYIPIEDDKRRYLIDNILYQDYQLVDQLLYPKGKDAYALKSLLPIDIRYQDATETSISGYVVSTKVAEVKIFSARESIISCFMHIPHVLLYLEVYPILQFCDRIEETDGWEYFKPIEELDIYIKAYVKGLEEFQYVRGILVMMFRIIKKYKPETLEDLRDPKWWICELSKHDSLLEHRGACHEMHVARMLDSISAEVMPVPDIDKRTIVSLLKYALQTDFSTVNVLSYENKRLRLNEAISTIVTSNVSDKLKKMFRNGKMLATRDMVKYLKFQPDIILKNMYPTGLIHGIDFANDMDYPHLFKFTKNGPNSLGKMDENKITRGHRQLHPSMIGYNDMYDYSTDVGQTGMISPWSTKTFTYNINKYPNIKFDLLTFKKHHSHTMKWFHLMQQTLLNLMLFLIKLRMRHISRLIIR